MTVQGDGASRASSPSSSSFFGTDFWYRESRRCSRDTYPESYITEYVLIYEDKIQGGGDSRPSSSASWLLERAERILGSGITPRPSLLRNHDASVPCGKYKTVNGATVERIWRQGFRDDSRPCFSASWLLERAERILGSGFTPNSFHPKPRLELPLWIQRPYQLLEALIVELGAGDLDVFLLCPLQGAQHRRTWVLPETTGYEVAGEAVQ